MVTKHNILFYVAILGLCLSGCSREQSPNPSGQQAAPVSFNVDLSTATDFTFERLYVVTRNGEHNNNEYLHCERIVDLQPGLTTYRFDNLLAQWYRFAFVSVPDAITYGEPSMTLAGNDLFVDAAATTSECDFNTKQIDYLPILKAQQQDSTLIRTVDLHLYRKVIDRWLLPDTELQENVTMNRITGQLSINFGELDEQFPQPIAAITVEIKVPTRVYIHDQAANEVITDIDSWQSLSFRYDRLEWNTGVAYWINLALLPATLNGKIVVEYLEPTAEGVTSESFEFAQSDATPISIKPNTRTTVRFNGMQEGYYEVRYAGMRDGNAVVGVDGPEWEPVQ